MVRLLHKILYRLLPLEGYLRVVSRMFFIWQRLGIGRTAPATEYVYHLERLVREGDTCIDIGANLGYYTRTIARLAGPSGRVLAVEPMPPMLAVLRRNVRRCRNVEILPYALGEENRTITMANTSALRDGYLGTGQNFVNDSGVEASVSYTAEMRRGTELFAALARIDFIKCDIEGYELHVMRQLSPLLEQHRPTVLIESGGANRAEIVRMFTEMGYKGFTLDRGREVPLTAESEKDIIFRGKIRDER